MGCVCQTVLYLSTKGTLAKVQKGEKEKHHLQSRLQTVHSTPLSIRRGAGGEAFSNTAVPIQQRPHNRSFGWGLSSSTSYR